jgi:hypothetical protein
MMNGMAHASEIVSFLARSKVRVAKVPMTILYTDTRWRRARR